MPTIKETSAIAQGSTRSDVRRRIASAIASVTPALARIFPSIAPKAMMMPTAPSVLPAPLIVALTTEPVSMPATMSASDPGCVDANELDGARYQGKHVAQITAKLTHH